jgi:sulfur carrier protein
MRAKGKVERLFGAFPILLFCHWFHKIKIMKIQLNNNLHTTDSNTLFGFLHDQNLANSDGIAVAVNDEVIPRSYWKEHIINENDQILVITATQGG